MIGILNDSSNSSTLVNLTITFDGLPDWASGFKIGVEPSINETATVTSNKQINSISILNKGTHKATLLKFLNVNYPLKSWQ